MLEAAELGNRVAEADWESRTPGLRVDLVNAQYDLRQARFPVLIVLVGDDRRGCSEAVNRLNQWMDARYVQTHVFGAPTPEEREHPRFWRYWRALPGSGELAVFTGAWALDTLGERLDASIDDTEFELRLDHIERFEQTLLDAGALVLKFWIHLPRKELGRRLKQAKKHPDTAAERDAEDVQIFERYDELTRLAERLLRRTDSSAAPWQIVEGTDPRHRDLRVAEAILAALSAQLPLAPPAPAAPSPPPSPPLAAPALLERVELTASLPRPEYKRLRDALQLRLRRLSRRAREQGVAGVLVFEGWDAAGKGGVIRRLSQAMDVQDYRILPIAAPSGEELAHHYLWRFWRQLPRRGRLLVFDRSWYGRVLVERVEGLARPQEWQRAYAEINDFEAQLVADGMLLRKFWLHIDPDEQLRRFRAREQTPYKKYKIVDEDYRNRERWDDYTRAVNEMVARTSTDLAPWQLVAANDKRWARVEVLKAVCDGLEERLGPE